jgi:hypothetical protein
MRDSASIFFAQCLGLDIIEGNDYEIPVGLNAVGQRGNVLFFFCFFFSFFFFFFCVDVHNNNNNEDDEMAQAIALSLLEAEQNK